MLTPNKIVTPPVKIVKLCGEDLSKFSIVVPDRELYQRALTYITRYFKIYCGAVLPVKQNGEEKTGPEIVFGLTDRTPDKKYKGFEHEVYVSGDSLYFGAANETKAAMAFDRFAALYLSTPGDAVIGFPENEPIFAGTEFDFELTPALLSVQDRIVRSMLKVQALLELDYAAGNFFSYQHVRFKPTIAEARETGIRVTNCVIVMNWVLKDAGVYSQGCFNHLYNGTVGYTTGNGELKEAMTGGNFEIIETEKTIKELGDEGNLLPGDIIFFRDYNADHNQIVYDRTNAIDGGRGNCFVREVGAPFRRFLGPNNCMNARVGLIFRSIDSQ